MISEIEFDEFGKFSIREGTNLNIRVFAYDFEDGLGVKNNLKWESNLDGILFEGTAKLDTSLLSIGTHFITVSTYDSKGEEAYLRFVLVVIDSNADLGDADGGGADRNGDGVIDENDRILTPQTVSDQIIRITKPSKTKLKRRSRRAKLRAVALSLDDTNNVEADVSSQIIWEVAATGDEASTESGLREFLAEGSVLKARKLPKGLQTIYARVGDIETSINVRVTRRKVIILN